LRDDQGVFEVPSLPGQVTRQNIFPKCYLTIRKTAIRERISFGDPALEPCFDSWRSGVFQREGLFKKPAGHNSSPGIVVIPEGDEIGAQAEHPFLAAMNIIHFVRGNGFQGLFPFVGLDQIAIPIIQHRSLIRKGDPSSRFFIQFIPRREPGYFRFDTDFPIITLDFVTGCLNDPEFVDPCPNRQ